MLPPSHVTVLVRWTHVEARGLGRCVNLDCRPLADICGTQAEWLRAQGAHGFQLKMSHGARRQAPFLRSRQHDSDTQQTGRNSSSRLYDRVVRLSLIAWTPVTSGYVRYIVMILHTYRAEVSRIVVREVYDNRIAEICCREVSSHDDNTGAKHSLPGYII